MLENREAERALLGSLMADPNTFYDVESIITPGKEAFYRTQHQSIYEAIKKLVKNNEPVDLVSVHAEAIKIHSGTDRSDVVDVASAGVTGALSDYYAKQVMDLYSRRRLLLALRVASEEVRDAGQDFLDTTSRLMKEIEASTPTTGSTEASINPEIVDLWEYYLDTLDGAEPTWIPTGFTDLDAVVSFAMGSHIIVGARPGMGKTSFVLNIAGNVAEMGKRPLFFTLEQTRKRMLQKIISQKARISHTRHIHGRLTDAEKDAVQRAVAKLAGLDMGILDGRWSVAEIRNRAIREAGGKGCDMIIVDLLQLLKPPTGMTGNKSHEIVTENTKQLQALGVEMQVPVITTAHLNRNVEQRTTARPLLSDLREAGEEFADIVMFLYRDEVYNIATPDPGVCEVLVPKNRDGEIGAIKLSWVGESTTFGTLSRQVDERTVWGGGIQ